MPTVDFERPDGEVEELIFPDEMPIDAIKASVKRYAASFQQPAQQRATEKQDRDFGRFMARMKRASISDTDTLTEGMPTSDADLTGPALMLGKAARFAGPIAAGILTRGRGVPVQMMAGAGAGAGGEAGAQIAEALFGSREKIQPGQIAGAGIAGAAPVAPARAAMATFKTMGSQALGAGLGSAAEQAIDKGDVSTGEAAVRAGFGGALGGIPSVVGGGAEIVRKKLIPAIGRAASIERIGPGVQATVEQAFPSMAAVARRAVERASGMGIKLRGVLQTQNERIGNAIGNIVGGGPIDNPNVVGAKILEGIGENQELARDFQAANEGLATLAKAIDESKDAAQRARLQVEYDQLRKQGQDVVSKALGLQNVGEFQKVAAGMKVGADIEGARDAFRAKASELYEPIKDVASQRLFDAAPLVDEANALMAQIPNLRGLGNFSKLIRRSDSEAKALGLQQPDYYASLNELRGMAGELWDAANDPNVAVGKNSSRLLKEFAGKIRATIDDQAESAIGAGLATQLKDANAFWAKYRPRFSELGIREAFMREGENAPKLAAQIAQDVMSEGAMASKYNNVVSLFKDMASDGVLNVPTTTELNTAMRQAVVAKARDPLTRAIDFEQLAPVVKQMEVQSPGTASKLGFGSVKELEEFAQRVGQLREAIPSQQIAKITKLIDDGNKAGMWVGAGAVNRIQQVADRRAIMDALRARAVAGSKPASEAIRSAQMSFMDETFDLSGQGRINPEEALQRWYASVKDGTAETILGKNAVGIVNDTIVPGLKTIGEAFVESKSVGGWSRGMQVTAAANVGKRTAERLLEGQPVKAATGLSAGSLMELGYDQLAKVIVRGAGVSGLRSKAATMRVISKLASMPKAAAIQAAYRYAETGEEPR